uniref:Solute carrier family 3 member 2 N-terminal domain-containing protein n=1 Tax=Glossina brevipalpis TaxID=37001 RepID=A0A1A9X0A0_9MUSC
MPLNEYSALINDHYKSAYTTFDNCNDHEHTVHIAARDITEYQTVFSLNEYPSSLTLDELLVFKDDPWWQKIRLILFHTFWLILIITFLIACLITYLEFNFNSCKTLHTSSDISTPSSSISLNIDNKFLNDLPLLTVH